ARKFRMPSTPGSAIRRSEKLCRWFLRVVVDLVDVADREAKALRPELEEGVERVRAVDAGPGVQAHGEAAPGAVLGASGSVMVGWGRVARGGNWLARNLKVGQRGRAFVLFWPWRRSLRRRAVS